MKSYPQITQISTDSIEENGDPETYALIGAAMEVHRLLGCGFLERVYRLALIEELKQRDIEHVVETELPVFYKGARLDCFYRVDLICMGSILVELKAKSALSDSDTSQLINYLKASGAKRGLLLNFGTQSLEFKRVVL